MAMVSYNPILTYVIDVFSSVAFSTITTIILVAIVFHKDDKRIKERLIDIFSKKPGVIVTYSVFSIIIYPGGNMIIDQLFSNISPQNDIDEIKIPFKIFFTVIIVAVFIWQLVMLFKYVYPEGLTISKSELLNRMDKVMLNQDDALATLDCVFSVSAIAIKNNKFLLVKRAMENESGKWVQPGSYYRTNRVFDKSKDEYTRYLPNTPYEYLIQQLNQEANICENDQFKLLDFGNSGIRETILTSRIGPEKLHRSTKLNKITPAPFLIQFEESNTKKTSGKHIHIDLFYALELGESYSIEEAQKAGGTKKYSEIRFFTLDEIEKFSKREQEEIYPDLYVVCQKFLEYYRKYKFGKYEIRTCMFNNSRNSILIRLGDICNASCYFCIRKDEKECLKQKSGKPRLPVGLKEHVVNTLKKEGCAYKLIFSGGEPFVYEDSLQEITAIVKENVSEITSVSICTNGIEWKNLMPEILDLNRLCKENGKPLKFVISLSWYNLSSLKKITGVKTNVYQNVIEFIQFLNKECIQYEISVVLTGTFRENISGYVRFWKDELKVKNISLTYGCKCDNKSLLSKEDCIRCYDELVSGKYAIEYFEKLEFSIPDCESMYCRQGEKMKNIVYNESNDKWVTNNGCVEKRRKDND